MFANSLKTATKRAFFMPSASQRLMMNQTFAMNRMVVGSQQRVYFSDAVMSQDQQRAEQSELDLADENKRLGIDVEFSKKQHAYALTFPWNFEEVIADQESKHRGNVSRFWDTYIRNSECKVKFAELFREFHQNCARNDAEGIDFVCEGRLAHAVKESMERIHFHGLDIEMANLTAEPDFKILKVDVSHGLSVNRASNGKAEDWNINESSVMGNACTYYTPADDQRDMWDSMDDDRKPFVVAVTCLIESPMKLYLLNQNHSKILLGTDNEETVKNVVRFEANLSWVDLADIMPTMMKCPKEWVITDYNDLMNENPFFPEQQ